MGDKKTMIAVHVTEKTKENIKRYLGDVTFKDLILFVESLFEEGDISVDDGQLCLNETEVHMATDSLVDEFYRACDAVSLDREAGMRKAIMAIKGRRI